MQATSSKILHKFYALASRNLQSTFHTSACALGGGKRPKGKSRQGGRAQNPTRSPARKRLVSSLKPQNKAVTYEVAPRKHTKSHDKDRSDHEPRTSRVPDDRSRSSPERHNRVQDDMPRNKGKLAVEKNGPQTSAPPGEIKFERDGVPHKGRLTNEEIRRYRGPRRRGVDFGLRGETARRPRFKPEVARRGLAERGEDNHANRPESPRSSKASSPVPVTDELHTPYLEPLKTLPSRFSSPPLLEGLLQSVHDVLGPEARPSPIQSLALKHLFTPPPHLSDKAHGIPSTSTEPFPSNPVWRQHLLAAETGSGKSIAYLLPVLQHLKLTENNPPPLDSVRLGGHHFPLNPRGLILAPTHELARQLSAFTKALLHHSRLRVLCSSRANTPSSTRGSGTARQLKRHLDSTGFGIGGVGSVGLHGNKPVDILVGTTTKILEMVRGLGWNRAMKIQEEWDEDRKERARRWVPGPPELGLANVEWVVVDEADVLFDKDFATFTRLLLADIARTRGYTHDSFAALDLSATSTGKPVPPPSTPVAYPFHFTLTSATIPASLDNYLSIAHPHLARLASPRLHRLPSTLTTEHYDCTSGNKNSDIEKRIRRVWVDDMQSAAKARSKVLVFCNKSTRVDDLGLYLKEKGIPNVTLTSQSTARSHGSNRHLDGFLKGTSDVSRTGLTSTQTRRELPSARTWASPSAPTPSRAPGDMTMTTPPADPHVLITTSLLSRGLDFSPQIQHVFVTDPPRNMVDFLHRAGRAGRAGNAGRVVLFGKTKGRGSSEAKDIRRRVGAVAH